MGWYEEHGGKVRLRARHFGFSPDTVRRWTRAYARGGLRGLEPQSRRPQRVRQSTTPTAVVERIQAVREESPRWGRERLRVLVAREGITLSAKTIDRVIHRLKARGVLREPLRLRKRRRTPHQERLRRPSDLVVDQPGALVQLDSKQVWVEPGKVLFPFGARDCFTRKRVVDLAPRLTSQAGAAFREGVVPQFPFPLQALQSDGGSEFLGAFGEAVQRLGVIPYVNRPNYPQSLP